MDVFFPHGPAVGAAQAVRSGELRGERQPTVAAKTSVETTQGEPKDERQPLEQAVSNIESFVQNIRRDLDFALDDSSGRVVVKVTDRVSGEVVRQIPSEEALRLAENLEEVRSLLFQAEA
ncbi:flagellar protein FlaG [Pseudomonas paeninsulae]|uniref:flagellar protein FlaG n=1 Tax=Pseudomonas paeninsulae TaxID=3110772 RepID=UPI002D7731EC|nr:flagellar protein FlaG [Pseudomonas sp. IT1137]